MALIRGALRGVFLVVVSVAVLATNTRGDGGNRWTLDDLHQDQWLLGGLAQEQTPSLPEPENNESIFKDPEQQQQQVTLSLPPQWTLLLDNLNTSKYHVEETTTAVEEDGDSFGPNATRIIFYEDFVTIPRSLVVDSFSAASESWLQRQRMIENVFFQKAGADSHSPVGTAFAFSPPSSEALLLSNTSHLLEYASLQFLKGLQDIQTQSDNNDDQNKKVSRVRRATVTFEDGTTFEKEDGMDLRSFVAAKGSMGAVNCGMHDEVLPCDPHNPFRTYSGFCNNIRNPGWGKSVITFDRMIPSAYADGVSKPRSNSATGRPLPSPRTVSTYVHIDVSHLSNKYTLMLMQYAQFLDHDITLTPVHKGPEDKILNCKECDSFLHVHPECWPIPIMEGDNWYPAKRQESGRPNCIPFTRSLPGQQRLGPREQINQNSAYIDASQIYGEDVCKADSLRIRGGKLNGTASAGRKALMPQTGGLKECKSPSGMCFSAGDPRASEQPALASVHTVFLRQHNTWAEQLKSLNPHWNDEKVYQETRRIMAATMQHITYNELLPRVLGPSMINAYGLRLQNEGYYAGYDASCSANVYNEFAAAAFRFGHSLIRPNLARMDGGYRGMSPHLPLRDGFFNSDMLYKSLMVDEVLRGLVAEPMEELDPFITNEITNHLFEDKRKSFSGLDLVSLNLQRGRDHGINGYNYYRAVCNLPRAKVWGDLSTEIPNDVLQRLQKVYAHVDDIDLFTGSLVERSVKGGLVGPVMTCIIASQFKKLRSCDRFWYETNDQHLRFSPQQLAEIRKMTLSKIVCDNMDIPSEIQRWAMDAPHNALNPRLPCNHLATLNVEAWKEVPSAGSGAAYQGVGAQPQPHALVSPNIPVPVPSPHVQAPAPHAQSSGCVIGGRQVAVGVSELQSPCVSCVCTAKGGKCASLRITSCSGLFKEASMAEILRDPVCTSQCGYLTGKTTNRLSG